MDYEKTFYRLEYVRDFAKNKSKMKEVFKFEWVKLFFFITNIIILIGENMENKDKYREENSLEKCIYGMMLKERCSSYK